jgi:hypothetical protein
MNMFNIPSPKPFRVVAVLAVSAACAFAPAASASAGAGATVLSGTWENTSPCNFTAGPDANGRFVCDGTSSWFGDVKGTTHYVASGIIFKDGSLEASLTETFTGTVAGVAGTLDFQEIAFIDGTTGAVRVQCAITDGTGGLASTRGRILFTGFADTNAIGAGDYSAVFKL